MTNGERGDEGREGREAGAGIAPMAGEIIEVKIAEIVIGERIRKDLGNLEALAELIEEVGLLQPIGITPDYRLVFGERRLRVCRDILGRETIPARIVPVESMLLGQIAENTMRKDYTVSERVAIAETLRSFTHGGDRRSVSTRSADGEAITVDEAAKRAGLGGKDGFLRAKTVLDSGVPELVQALDQEEISLAAAAELASLEHDEQKSLLGKKKDWTAKQIAQRKAERRFRQAQEDQRKAVAQVVGNRQWTLTADQSIVDCDLLIVDPPYGITAEPWEPDDLESYTRDWASRWSSCGAHFVAIFFSQRHEFEGRRWFDEALRDYRFQQKLIWHAPNNLAPKSRGWFKQTWEPIFLYRRLESGRQVHEKDSVWSGELHDLDCHIAPVPQVNYGADNYKVHPCQKPVSTMRWLINALSRPGERVVSLFCGVSPCGIAAVQLGRQYHGIEINEEYRRLADERIAAFGTADNPATLLAQPSTESVRKAG